MQTLRAVLVMMSLAMLAVPVAEARSAPQKKVLKKNDGRWARPHVIQYHKARGRTTNIRTHKVRFSASGKSSQVAVANKFGGKVRLYNVNRRTGKVSATRTGLVSQNKAMTKANRSLRRRNGTFAGVYKQGLSKSGKSYKFRSQTSSKRAYVTLKGGQLRRLGKQLQPAPYVIK